MTLKVVEAGDAFKGMTAKQGALVVINRALSEINEAPDDVEELSTLVPILSPSGLTLKVPNSISTLEVLGILDAAPFAVVTRFLGGPSETIYE